MRKTLAVLALLLPALAFGQGANRPRPDRPLVIAGFTGAHAAPAVVASITLPAPATFTSWSVYIVTGSGGGAGNTVVTASDGTNTCTFTLACTPSATPGPFDVTAANGTGTGCAFPAGRVTFSVTTGGCTTTQPTPRSSFFLATWR